MAVMPNIGVVNMKRDHSKGTYLWHKEKLGYRRVTTEEEFTEAKREGWDEKYVSQELPRMMHHPVPDQSRVANTQEEVEALINQGYELDPKAFTEKKIIDAKIAQVEAELRQLNKNKKELVENGGIGMKRAV